MLKHIFVEHSQISHEDFCDFMIILCPSCKELMRVNEQERHNERECPERTLYCKYCKEPFQLKNIKVRLNSLDSNSQPMSQPHHWVHRPGHCVRIYWMIVVVTPLYYYFSSSTHYFNCWKFQRWINQSAIKSKTQNAFFFFAFVLAIVVARGVLSIHSTVMVWTHISPIFVNMTF